MSADFETFARDHKLHRHCISCGGCIFDQRPLVADTSPLWCVQCRARLEVALPPGRRPWEPHGWTAEQVDACNPHGTGSIEP